MFSTCITWPPSRFNPLAFTYAIKKSGRPSWHNERTGGARTQCRTKTNARKWAAHRELPFRDGSISQLIEFNYVYKLSQTEPINEYKCHFTAWPADGNVFRAHFCLCVIVWEGLYSVMDSLPKPFCLQLIPNLLCLTKQFKFLILGHGMVSLERPCWLVSWFLVMIQS